VIIYFNRLWTTRNPRQRTEDEIFIYIFIDCTSMRDTENYFALYCGNCKTAKLCLEYSAVLKW